MIVKKIKTNPRTTPGKAARVTRLIVYIDAPENRRQQEKCVYAGARNCLCASRAGQKAEMIALAQEAVASRNPIQHWVLSWRESEQPTPAQVEQAVDLFLDELGMRAHQALYAFHADTDDFHLHLVVNRVHPETLKAIKPNGGFDLEAAHRAIARIEHIQRWEREPNGRYRVSATGELVRESRRREPGPGSKARDLEARTGTRSAARIALAEGAPLLRRATGWADLHRGLAARGLRLEPRGRGAVLWVGEIAVKVSRLGRECGLGALSQRLGAYRPAESDLQPDERVLESVQSDWPEKSAYRRERQNYHQAKARDLGALRRRQQAERQALRDRHREARHHWLRGSWQGRGLQLNALRSALATLQAGERVALRDRHGQERAALRQRYPRFPDDEEWRRERRDAGSSTPEGGRQSEPPDLPVGGPRAPVSGDSEAPQARQSSGTRPAVSAGVSATEIYRRHFQDIRGREGSALDRSRVDAMIAVRLRITGHSRAEIVAILANGAPTLRAPEEERDWPRYAARAVRYAFGPAGDREVERLARYREPWRALESRPLQRWPSEPGPSWR